MKITESQLQDILLNLIILCNYDDDRKQNGIDIKNYLHTADLRIGDNKILLNIGQYQTGDGNTESTVLTKEDTKFFDNKFLITIEKLEENHHLYDEIYSWISEKNIWRQEEMK